MTTAKKAKDPKPVCQGTISEVLNKSILIKNSNKGSSTVYNIKNKKVIYLNLYLAQEVAKAFRNANLCTNQIRTVTEYTAH
jgi:hypothetical protein